MSQIGPRRLNIGCGMTPTGGWLNLDNSFSVRLAKLPTIVRFGRMIGVIDAAQYAFIEFARRNAVAYTDVRKPLPFKDSSIEAIYSSHMLEHLDRPAAEFFVEEAFRILEPGGVIRLAVPDLATLAANYTKSGNADDFVFSLRMSQSFPKGWRESIRLKLTSFRDHRWMYDGKSLIRLLSTKGFFGPHSVAAGETNIVEPGELNLHERVSESVYVEAWKPGLQD